MAQLMDHVTYLSKEIGPRPAGTEEEQRAALYITEQFQKETGFSASMEEFSSSSNVEAGLAVMAGITVLVSLLAMIFPVLAIPAFILGVAAAVVYSLEEFDKPIISRILSRGASQNVVAKYQPAPDAENSGSRRGASRKIILMAHYDTGNVLPPVIARLESSKIPLALICVGGIIAAAFFLLIRIFVASGGGMGLLVLNVLTIIALLICLYPIVKAVLLKMAPYNEGATNNATGTAALIEVAKRIAHGSVSEAELAETEEDVVIHGEEAARAAGLIPEGVQLVYEADEVLPPPVVDEYDSGYDEEERLLSAKAAIAALTGQPVENKIYSQVSSSRSKERDENDFGQYYGDAYYENGELPYDERYAQDYAAQFDYGYQDEYSTEGTESIDGFENAPSWFVAAQQNARKSENASDKEPQIRKSRYTEAIETAERNLAQREEEMRIAKIQAREEARRAREEEYRAMLAAQQEQQQLQQAQHAAVAGQPAGPVAGIGSQMAAYQAGDTAQGQESAPVDTSTAQVPATPVVPQRPDSTIAMVSHTPSSEIIAEALAADAAANDNPPQQLSAEAIPTPNATVDATAIPSPAEAQEPQGQITALPPIDPANPYSTPSADKLSSSAIPAVVTTPAVTKDPSRSGILRKLRTNIPSLSGLISPVPESSTSDNRNKVEEKVDYSMEVPLGAGATGAQSPVSGRNSVDIPRSRSGSFLNRLRNNENEQLSDTPQQWLDVDQDFDPRSARREQGGWESFRDDRYFEDEDIDEFGTDDSKGSGKRNWQGGAYSRVQLGHVSTLSGEDSEADTAHVEEMPAVEDEAPIVEEIQQIYHFRNPNFNTEIWFVAVGADGESHDGARAFIDEHRDELRGAMMIEIESLGAGHLAVASEEGRVRKVIASSRVKRYTRAATAATGIAVNSVSLAGRDSIASTLQKAGFQAMHLFGAEDDRPALKGSADDVVENVDELALEEHVGFVYELLKR